MSNQWLDNYGIRMLGLAATLVAADAVDWDVPVRFVTAEELVVGGARGVTTHAEGAKACRLANARNLTASPFFNKANPAKPLTDHHDPGGNFPIDWFLAEVTKRFVENVIVSGYGRDYCTGTLEGVGRGPGIRT